MVALLYEIRKSQQMGCPNIQVRRGRRKSEVLRLVRFPRRILKGILSSTFRRCRHQQVGNYVLFPKDSFGRRVLRRVFRLDRRGRIHRPKDLGSEVQKGTESTSPERGSYNGCQKTLRHLPNWLVRSS